MLALPVTRADLVAHVMLGRTISVSGVHHGLYHFQLIEGTPVAIRDLSPKAIAHVVHVDLPASIATSSFVRDLMLDSWATNWLHL